MKDEEAIDSWRFGALFNVIFNALIFLAALVPLLLSRESFPRVFSGNPRSNRHT